MIRETEFKLRNPFKAEAYAPNNPQFRSSESFGPGRFRGSLLVSLATAATLLVKKGLSERTLG